MADEKAEAAAETKPAKIAYVAMVRDPDAPAPHTAQVHPDEVENYKRGDWKVAE